MRERQFHMLCSYFDFVCIIPVNIQYIYVYIYTRSTAFFSYMCIVKNRSRIFVRGESLYFLLFSGRNNLHAYTPSDCVNT